MIESTVNGIFPTPVYMSKLDSKPLLNALNIIKQTLALKHLLKDCLNKH
jgi:hypothetical protein